MLVCRSNIFYKMSCGCLGHPQAAGAVAAVLSLPATAIMFTVKIMEVAAVTAHCLKALCKAFFPFHCDLHTCITSICFCSVFSERLMVRFYSEREEQNELV